jgi:hypothetical protein
MDRQAEIAALAEEIHTVNVDLYGVPDDQGGRDAALRQAYGQLDDLLEYAVAWDERAVWQQFGLALAEVRLSM